MRALAWLAGFRPVTRDEHYAIRAQILANGLKRYDAEKQKYGHVFRPTACGPRCCQHCAECGKVHA